MREVIRRTYWPKLNEDVQAFVAACEDCQRNKIDRQAPQGYLQPLQTPARPGTHYSVDLLTSLPKSGEQGFDTVLVIVDRYSKRVWAIPTWLVADGKLLVAELFVKHVVMENGVPVEIVSDRDPRFTNPNARSTKKHSSTTLAPR